ncbi:SGNH/GDSL hydrolase family protein [Chondrinema litorale]|uniref:SGNH/GDSL hydrolase family protein n=1 Tax=Chondrinema litorale TaxID=2994555 RepID=UPI0025432D72|nr:SGNH/GDSL hydrolase family protein [Chondrinema litorale]UZR93413.1 SGNH/GDSL hydrolase family protein [Chondrinema litorale]
MKPRALSFIKFVLPIIVIGVALYLVSEAFSPVYPLLKVRKKNLFLSVDNEVDALSIGNSHAGAIHFKTLGLNGIHFWDAAEDIYETKYKLDFLLQYYPNLKKVFIPISPFLMDQNNAEVFYHAQFHPRIRLHVNTNSWQPLQNKFNFLLLGKLSPILRYDHWAFVPKLLTGIKDIQANDPRMESVSKNGYLHFKYAEVTSSKMLENICKNNLKEHKRLIEGKEYEALFYEKLNEVIDLLKSKNIELVLYTPPYYQYYNQISKSTLSDKLSEVSSFAATHQVLYYDFSDYAVISSNWHLYDDGTHLNEQGRIAFSELLKKHIQ